jgi:hypothetical protein
MKKFIAFASVFLLNYSAFANEPEKFDGAYVSPYCAVGDDHFGSVPGVRSYDYHSDGFALRKPDGGLISVQAERGVGCEVTLHQTSGKLIAHVIARRVSIEPLVKDKEGILLEAPKSRTDYWEKEVDVSTVDRMEVSQADNPLQLKVVVGVQRTKD